MHVAVSSCTNAVYFPHIHTVIHSSCRSGIYKSLQCMVRYQFDTGTVIVILGVLCINNNNISYDNYHSIYTTKGLLSHVSGERACNYVTWQTSNCI